MCTSSLTKLTKIVVVPIVAFNRHIFAVDYFSKAVYESLHVLRIFKRIAPRIGDRTLRQCIHVLTHNPSSRSNDVQNDSLCRDVLHAQPDYGRISQHGHQKVMRVESHSVSSVLVV